MRASSFVEERKSFRRRVTSGCDCWELPNAPGFFFLRTTSTSSLSCDGCQLHSFKRTRWLTLMGPCAHVGHRVSSPFSRHVARYAAMQSLQLGQTMSDSSTGQLDFSPLMYTYRNDHGSLHHIQAYRTFGSIVRTEVGQHFFCKDIRT